jgi:outer membrane autotransporter protein
MLQGTTTSLQGNILNNGAVTFDQSAAGTYAGNMSGSGSLTIQGGGTVTLTGANSYSGGTSVLAGALVGNTTSLQGNILNNGSVTFNQTGTGSYAGNMSGSGSMTLQGGGTLVMTGNNTYGGATTVDASTLVVNGSLASTVTVSNGGVLAGNGSIGAFVSTGGILAPGNSIGTLNINGNFTQNGGTYVVEVNPQGQSDKVNVNGTATINGAAVQVLAQPGNYATSTTYTILSATGGVSGTYTGVTSNYAFLTPSLSYDTNNVFLTLALQGNAFSGFGGNTVNQRAVGYALDQSYANASGDFATVIGALANLNTQQGPWALNQISGQPYADFGSFNVANNALFMNALGQQMALARGGSGNGQRQALAQACDVAACDAASPFSVWGSVLGGVGSVQGDGNSSTFTYNVGGTAAGIDYRLNPSFLVGLGVGYTNGTQWVDSFQGKGWSNTLSVAAYGSFTQGGLYVDALAGYAYSNNQMQRQISIPGLQQRMASGSTGANQFLGQIEAGYKLGVYAPAQATVTPFARFQISSINQAAFSEWGADSLSLNVAQQTTTSARTVLGADLAGAVALGDSRTLDLGLRLGWMHEYANTARPATAAFAGAPTSNFTVYGATPQRDAAVIGFQASTNVADSTQIYLRYDGDVGSGTDNHAFNLGMRIRW